MLGIPISDVLDIDLDKPNLADLRRLAAETQLHIVKAAGLPTSIVQEFEQGATRLMAHRVSILADALGIEPACIRSVYDPGRTRPPGTLARPVDELRKPCGRVAFVRAVTLGTEIRPDTWDFITVDGGGSNDRFS